MGRIKCTRSCIGLFSLHYMFVDGTTLGLRCFRDRPTLEPVLNILDIFPGLYIPNQRSYYESRRCGVHCVMATVLGSSVRIQPSDNFIDAFIYFFKLAVSPEIPHCAWTAGATCWRRRRRSTVLLVVAPTLARWSAVLLHASAVHEARPTGPRSRPVTPRISLLAGQPIVFLIY